MRWHDVLWAISREAQAHPLLAEIYGSAIRMSGTQEHAVPSLEYFIVADSASELWEPCIIQWDQWTTSLEDLVRAEAALRSLFDHALPVTMQAVVMWSQFTDGAELTSPERAGYYGRALRFRMTPLRDCLRGGRSCARRGTAPGVSAVPGGSGPAPRRGAPGALFRRPYPGVRRGRADAGRVSREAVSGRRRGLHLRHARLHAGDRLA